MSGLLTRTSSSPQGIRLPLLLEGCVLILLLVPTPSIGYTSPVLHHLPTPLPDDRHVKASLHLRPGALFLETSHRFCSLQATVPICGRRLKHGIRNYHEAPDEQDKRIIQRLFESGVIRLLVVSKATTWSLPVASYMVIIMGVQFYEGKEHRYIDYPVMDVLQMMGRACRPLEDERSRCVLMCQQTRKDF